MGIILGVITMLIYKFTKRTEPPYFLVTFEPELEFLSAYLFLIFDRKTYAWVKEGIDSVLNKGMGFAERDMEWYGAEIRPETTRIYPTLEDSNIEGNTIKTADFDAVLTAYIAEKEKYDKQRML